MSDNIKRDNETIKYNFKVQIANAEYAINEAQKAIQYEIGKITAFKIALEEIEKAEGVNK